MIASMLIVFREMLEMILVVSVLLAATKSLPGSRRWIALGAAAGLLGALFFGLFMEEMESSFDSNGEFIFNAIILSIASLLIAWTVFWMGRQGRAIAQRMNSVGASVVRGDAPTTALAVVTLSAVMREGSEAAFFLFGAAQGVAEDGWVMLTGGLLGAALALGVGALIYFGLARIPLKPLFAVAGWLLMLLAAGMASQAAENLVMINLLPALADPLWNSGALLSTDSMAGEMLHVLIGYDEQPSGLQVAVFVAALVAMVVSYHRAQAPSASRTSAAA